MDDIPLLAEHFLARLNETRRNGNGPVRLSEEGLAALQQYDWPGNVRELENALERAAVLSPGPEISVDGLPGRVRSPGAAPLVSERPATNPTLELIERAYILWVLEAEGGNKARAAEVLGIDPSTLYRKLNRYGATTTS
jgi:two-component system response regulator HydG